MAGAATPAVPEQGAVDSVHRTQIARTVNLLLRGKLNAVAAVTLSAGATSTTVTDERLGIASFIAWMPLTASASLAERAGIWVAAQGKGTATLSHAASAATDQRFALLVIG